MFGGEKCHINQAFPADIRVVRSLFLQGKSTAGNTKPCIRKRTGLQRQEDMAAAGEERARSSYSFIHSVRNACEMASQNLQRLWTTSFRTVVIRSSSGTDQTGRRFARDATTGRQGERTAIRRIGIEGHEQEKKLITRCAQEPMSEGRDRLLFLKQFSGLAGSDRRLDIGVQYR